MIIERIELNQFRNYEHLILEPHEGINLFYGPNGSGKTNLLEAIHLCALGKSHRVNHDQNLVMYGQSGASCVIRVQGRYAADEIQVQLQSGEDHKKNIYVNSVRISRFSDLMGRLRCVLFSPEDLSVIRSGPSVRRRFLDMMISQVSSAYFIALQQYRIALDHRTSILKNCKINGQKIPEMIEDFEAAMVKQAEIIIKERERIIQFLAGYAGDIYFRISGSEKEKLRLHYRSSLLNAENPQMNMRKMLQEGREEDMRFGQTCCGPHRDDLIITLNQKDMKIYASQGQVRTAILSLRLAQLSVLKELGGEMPILLLDDVMSELDFQRRMNLIQEMTHTQTFITFADEQDIKDIQNHRTYYVSVNNGKADVTEKSEGSPQFKEKMTEPNFS